MQSKGSQAAILKLAKKISAIMSLHPNPEEAETACAIARELASLRTKQSSRIRVGVNQSLK
jgi:hypothetical protein